MTPGAGQRRQTKRGMHIGGAVTRTGKTVTQAQKAFGSTTVKPGELDDLFCLKPGNLRGPFGCPVAQMLLELIRHVAVITQVLAIHAIVGKQLMHHRTGQRAVGSGAQHQVQIGFLRGGVTIRIDHHQFRAALAPCFGDVVHDVDLGINRVAAPHHDQIALRHRARIRTPFGTGTGNPAGIRHRDTKSRVLPRRFQQVAKQFDRIALYQPHGAGIVIRPQRFVSMTLHGPGKFFCNLVERLVPANRLKGVETHALFAASYKRLPEPIGMVNTLPVPRDLGANHAGRVIVIAGPDHAPDGFRIEQFDFQRTGAGTIVRAGRMRVAGVDFSAHERHFARLETPVPARSGRLF